MGRERTPQSEGFGCIQLLLLGPQGMAGIRPTAATFHAQKSLIRLPPQGWRHCPSQADLQSRWEWPALPWPGSEHFKSTGRFGSRAIQLFGNEWALCDEGDQPGFSLWRHLLMVGMFGVFKYSAL